MLRETGRQRDKKQELILSDVAKIRGQTERERGREIIMLNYSDERKKERERERERGRWRRQELL